MIPIVGDFSGWFSAAGGTMSAEEMYRNAQAAALIPMLYGAQSATLPMCCLQPWELLPLLQCATNAPEHGCFVEVGVYQGGSAYHLTQLALYQSRQIYLYDTFEGMPYKDTIDVLPLGQLAADFKKVRETVGPHPHMYKCVFPHDVDFPPEPIAFAHIDVDQYRSTKETIQALAPLMAPGGIMWFDDVAGGPLGGLEGARLAVYEVFGTNHDIDPTTKRWFKRF